MDKALKSVLDWWEASGVDVPEIKSAPRPKIKAVQKTSSPVRKPSQPAAPPSSEVIAKSAKTLDDLRKAITDFDAGTLSDGARQAVFSRGNPEADIMVIGEAPGRDEDLQGQPFVGRAGQLLDKMLGAIGLSEETAYITNVCFWRPPKNRNPKPDELALCMPFVHRHIELIDPKVIVIVGGVSMTALTGETGIMKNRGQWKELAIGDKTYPALPLYHPAFLLRQPALKRDAWRDLLTLRARMDQDA